MDDLKKVTVVKENLFDSCLMKTLGEAERDLSLYCAQLKLMLESCKAAKGSVEYKRYYVLYLDVTSVLDKLAMAEKHFNNVFLPRETKDE